MPLKWVAKSASWYNDDPLFSAKSGINMGHIFKIFLKWRKNRPNFINLKPKFLNLLESLTILENDVTFLVTFA